MSKIGAKDNLNPNQKEAVEYSGGPLLIAAGAGSGKTKTLTNRLAWLIKNGAPPANIIAITFTNKAAKEMAERISVPSETFIGTFHSLGARILKKEAKFAKRAPSFTIFDDDDSLSLIKKLMKEMNLSKEKFSPLELERKISQIKNEFLDPAEFDDVTAEVFKNYETALVKNNAFDFDDLIEKVVKIFQKNPEVLKKYQEKFKFILVDEYQDINTSQYQLIKLLAEEHKNLSVVGDDQQAIYSFRGADFRNFLNFENDWPGAKIIKLEQNYRSSGTIINAASGMIKNNKFQTPKTLWTENAEGNLIKVIKAPDPETEAEWIATEISKPRRELPPTAIIYRTNAQSRSIEQALIVAGIPYKIFGGFKFYERKEIKDLLAGLRLAFNSKDSVSKDRLEKNFDKKTAAHLILELPRLSEKLKIIELINFFINNTDYFEYLRKNYKNYPERIENVNELIRFASEFETLDEFLERVALLQSTDSPKNQILDSRFQLPVSLMTIHLAKGLEFDRVFVVGCSEGLLPHQMSYGSLEELEEERRLMYVAMTRAKKELALSFTKLPSRFVYEIPPELTEFVDLGGNETELPDEEEAWIDY
ncbi:MAG: UvrD-helicase domain-containing protein [Candidatus Harrisonbacteria bacterium]|nr:UvrD-helicase domain-containing protein [Candidatus Harrisonbacteria bacterium]